MSTNLIKYNHISYLYISYLFMEHSQDQWFRESSHDIDATPNDG